MSGYGVTGIAAPLPGAVTPYPVTLDINGQGGWQSVANIAARNAILPTFRKQGMVVVTLNTGIAWQLIGGIDDGSWAVLAVFYQTILDSDSAAMPQEPALHFGAAFTLLDEAGLATRVNLNGILLPTVSVTDNDNTIQVVGGVWSQVINKKIYLTAQNAAIGITNVFGALPGAGLYRVSAFLDVTTHGTSGTLATRINFTPDDGVADFTIVTSALDTSIVGSSSGVAVIESNGAAQITYEVDAVALVTGGTLVYTLRIVVEQIG